MTVNSTVVLITGTVCLCLPNDPITGSHSYQPIGLCGLKMVYCVKVLYSRTFVQTTHAYGSASKAIAIEITVTEW